jgi:hypothetical protein
VPGLTAMIISMIPPGTLLVAIDENTAMIGDGTIWTVSGESQVHLLEDGTWTHHVAGEGFERLLV